MKNTMRFTVNKEDSGGGFLKKLVEVRKRRLRFSRLDPTVPPGSISKNSKSNYKLVSANYESKIVGTRNHDVSVGTLSSSTWTTRGVWSSASDFDNRV